jgi:hypothetical protein
VDRMGGAGLAGFWEKGSRTSGESHSDGPRNPQTDNDCGDMIARQAYRRCDLAHCLCLCAAQGGATSVDLTDTLPQASREGET